MGGSEGEFAPDWRGDLLHAVHAVFAQDMEGLRAEVHTHHILHPTDHRSADSGAARLETAVKQLVSDPVQSVLFLQ